VLIKYGFVAFVSSSEFSFLENLYREQKKLVLDTFFVPQNTRTDSFLLFQPIY